MLYGNSPDCSDPRSRTILNQTQAMSIVTAVSNAAGKRLMHASRYFDASKDATWMNERRLQTHLKRLNEIRSRSVQNHYQPATALRASMSRLKVMSYWEAERIEAIRRENQLLMQKLLKIAESHSEMTQPKQTEHHSMNSHLRRKEKVRIRTENEFFSKRLIRQELGSKKRLAGSFDADNPVCDQISKAYLTKSKFRPTRKGKVSESASEVKLTVTTEPRAEGKVQKRLGKPSQLSPFNRSFHGVDLDKSPVGMTLDEYLGSKCEITVIADSQQTRTKQRPYVPLPENTAKHVNAKGGSRPVKVPGSVPVSKRSPSPEAAKSEDRGTKPLRQEVPALPLPLDKDDSPGIAGSVAEVPAEKESTCRDAIIDVKVQMEKSGSVEISDVPSRKSSRGRNSEGSERAKAGETRDLRKESGRMLERREEQKGEDTEKNAQSPLPSPPLSPKQKERTPEITSDYGPAKSVRSGSEESDAAGVDNQPAEAVIPAVEPLDLRKDESSPHTDTKPPLLVDLKPEEIPIKESESGTVKAESVEREVGEGTESEIEPGSHHELPAEEGKESDKEEDKERDSVLPETPKPPIAGEIGKASRSPSVHSPLALEEPPSMDEKPRTLEASEPSIAPEAAEQSIAPEAAEITPEVTQKPKTPEVAEQPITPKASEKPQTPEAAEKPLTPIAAEKPMSPKATEKPEVPIAPITVPEEDIQPADPKSSEQVREDNPQREQSARSIGIEEPAIVPEDQLKAPESGSDFVQESQIPADSTEEKANVDLAAKIAEGIMNEEEGVEKPHEAVQFPMKVVEEEVDLKAEESEEAKGNSQESIEVAPEGISQEVDAPVEESKVAEGEQKHEDSTPIVEGSAEAIEQAGATDSAVLPALPPAEEDHEKSPIGQSTPISPVPQSPPAEPSTVPPPEAADINPAIPSLSQEEPPPDSIPPPSDS